MLRQPEGGFLGILLEMQELSESMLCSFPHLIPILALPQVAATAFAHMGFREPLGISASEKQFGIDVQRGLGMRKRARRVGVGGPARADSDLCILTWIILFFSVALKQFAERAHTTVHPYACAVQGSTSLDCFS